MLLFVQLLRFFSPSSAWITDHITPNEQLYSENEPFFSVSVCERVRERVRERGQYIVLSLVVSHDNSNNNMFK